MKPNHPAFTFVTFWVLGSFLAACTMLPQPASQVNSRRSDVQIEPASYQGQTTQAKQPEKITFPSMVKTTSLGEPTGAQHQQLNEALKKLMDEDEGQGGYQVSAAQGPQVEIVRFMSKTNNPKHQVKIAETGSFRVVLEAGTKRELEVTDADTTDDGVARLRLPTGTFETSLHLQGPWKSSSSLEIEDSLYYVKDALNTKTGRPFDPNRWHLLGLRPLPVPQDWLSPDGQSFVVQIKVEDVKEFQLAWRREAGPAPFPPGINQIGPEGGNVNLPGIAELEIPPNAITNKITFSLHQVTSLPNLTEDNGFYGGYSYIGPAVKIDPQVDFREAPFVTALKISLDKEYLKNINSNFIKYIYIQDEHLPIKPTGQLVGESGPSLDSHFSLPYSGTIAPVYNTISLNKKTTSSENENSSFRTTQTDPLKEYDYEKLGVFLIEDTVGDEAYASVVDKVLERSWEAYRPIQASIFDANDGLSDNLPCSFGDFAIST